MQHGERPCTSRSLCSPLPTESAEKYDQRQTLSRQRSSSYGSHDLKSQAAYVLLQQSANNNYCGSEHSVNEDHAPLIPRPPSRPSIGAAQPRSAKGRIYPRLRIGREDLAAQGSNVIAEEKHPFPPRLKTQSSFSKYKPLPSIGIGDAVTPEDSISLHDSFTDKAASIGDAEPNLLELADQSNDTETRICLAVKLPNGSRHERWFRHTDTLGTVLLFAKTVSKGHLPPCRLFTNEMPRRVFTDLSQTLRQSGISSRTVLYLEEVYDS